MFTIKDECWLWRITYVDIIISNDTIHVRNAVVNLLQPDILITVLRAIVSVFTATMFFVLFVLVLPMMAMLLFWFYRKKMYDEQTSIVEK